MHGQPVLETAAISPQVNPCPSIPQAVVLPMTVKKFSFKTPGMRNLQEETEADAGQTNEEASSVEEQHTEAEVVMSSQEDDRELLPKVAKRPAPPDPPVLSKEANSWFLSGTTGVFDLLTIDLFGSQPLTLGFNILAYNVTVIIDSVTFQTGYCKRKTATKVTCKQPVTSLPNNKAYNILTVTKKPAGYFYQAKLVKRTFSRIPGWGPFTAWVSIPGTGTAIGVTNICKAKGQTVSCHA